MTLGELIRVLETADPTRECVFGFGAPMSYRGVYAQLAFKPETHVTVRDMLKDARSAVGRTFEGYKGGHYTMSEDTNVWIAAYGQTSDNSALRAVIGCLFDDSEVY